MTECIQECMCILPDETAASLQLAGSYYIIIQVDSPPPSMFSVPPTPAFISAYITTT